jgi:phosphoserine phosphatase
VSEARDFSTEIGGRDSSLRLSKLPQLTALVKDFQAHDEAAGEAALTHREGLETLLLLDANKTLTAQDTGMMFWQHLGCETGSMDNPLETLFKTEGSTYQSFRKATLLYEGVMCSFTEICDTVTAEVAVYPEMLELLLRAKNQPHIAAVVVTCGIRYVWESVLARHGFSHVTVIGGARLSDGYVVTDTTTGRVVNQLHGKGLRVVAFGDSPLDVQMLQKAGEAYVFVGEEATRSHLWAPHCKQPLPTVYPQAKSSSQIPSHRASHSPHSVSTPPA